MVKVKSINSTQKINVSNSNQESIVSAVNTLSKYYSDLAQEYANDAQKSAELAEEYVKYVSDGADSVLANVQKAETEALEKLSTLKSQSESSISIISETSLNYINNAFESIKDNIEESLIDVDAEIQNKKNAAVATVSSTGDEYVEQINSLGTNYINEIEETYSVALSNVETAKENAEEYINDMASSIKTSTVNDIQTNANSIKNTATQEIEDSAEETIQLSKDWANKLGDTVDGEEYSSKYYAGLSKEYADASKASARWGRIVGDINDQVDLKNLIDIKGDGLLYEQGLLYLTSNGEKISDGIKVAATGGGSGGTTFTLTTEEPDELYVAYGETANISYTYTSTENESATAQYFVNNELKDTAKIPYNGTITYDLSKILSEGYNYVQIKVTDIYGLSKSILLTVNTISLTITSSFDSSVAYSSDVNFRYTPVGNVDKIMHFLVDGVELTETISISGRQLSKNFSFEHGVHTLKVWATATINNIEIKSNELSYEIIYVSDTSILISSEYVTRPYLQGEMVSIPYNVYNPNSLTSSVEVRIDGELVSSLNVDRTRQVWSKSINESGEKTITISSGEVSRSFKVTIEAVNIEVKAVEENLELYLTADGRDNNAIDKETWVYNNVECSLIGFNYVTNGWVNNSLKVSSGARVIIPVQIFKNDFRTNGKTIEIEFSTSNILDYDSIVIDCMNDRGFRVTAQNAYLKSEQSEVSVKFKEDEKVRLSFVVENRASNRLIYTYLNGIISGITQYPVDDDFHQLTPLNITIGNDNCNVNIYNIRVYDTCLTEYDILNNYISDTADVQEKLELYTRNNIYDSYGNVVYNKILNQLPIMTITGDLPTAKGDKKLVSIRYEDSFNQDNNFTMNNVTLDIQGTSSQYYPKKNYKISKLPVAYKLRPNAIAEKVFTLKADYMESSHAHNTGLARFVNDLYTTKTPAQRNNDSVRTAIDGFPIAIYYRKNANTPASYFGVYNFNNDKSSNNTFGFTEGCESWEFTNNTSPRCLFQSDDFSNKADVLTDFEARYPSDYTDTTNLEKLIKWVVSCDYTKATNANLEVPETIDTTTYLKDTQEYRIAKFKYELPIYFDKDFLLTYYIVSEFFGMVDSRAKNMFLNMYTTGIWYPVFYDLDTAIGLNNEGINNFSFNIENHDTIGTENVFNGANSVLWNLVEKAFSKDIQDLYNSYRNRGSLSYDNVLKYLNSDQIAKICEAQYNADANFKYISPLVNDNIATYLYTAQGSRIDHIKWWLFNRFHYMDSKYIASDYKANYLTMRLYTPETWSDVEPNAEIIITPYIDQYVRIKYGAYDVGTRAKHNEATTLTPPDIQFNDTETIIYGADKIVSIGDLSPLYAGTIDVSAATKLSELKIGAGGNYSNTNLKNLALGNNTLLNKLDIRNCPNLTGALDISGCTNIKEIYATGTSLTSVKFANAGSITKLQLPNTITNLTIKNQNNIESFICGNSISTLVIENCNIDAKAIYSASKPTKVRIIGIDWTLENFSLLDEIYGLLGVDENGYNTEHGVLAGVIRLEHAKQSTIAEYKKKFVGLTFVVGSYDAEDYIRTDGGYVITTNENEALLYT